MNIQRGPAPVDFYGAAVEPVKKTRWQLREWQAWLIGVVVVGGLGWWVGSLLVGR